MRGMKNKHPFQSKKGIVIMPKFSQHARMRSAQRNVSHTEVEYIIAHGKLFRQAGARIYFLYKRDIPKWDLAVDRWRRLAGTAVILTKDGRKVLTLWRNQRHGSKHIRCKPKYSMPWKDDFDV